MDDQDLLIEKAVKKADKNNWGVRLVVNPEGALVSVYPDYSIPRGEIRRFVEEDYVFAPNRSKTPF